MALLLTHPMQNLGAGDVTGLAVKVFQNVLKAFEIETVFWPRHMRVPIMGEGTGQFHATTRSSSTLRFPGQEMTGSGNPQQELREIPIDQFIINDHGFRPIQELRMQPWDTQANVAYEYSASVARAVDKDVARMIALGARQPQRTTASGQIFDSGVLLASPRAGGSIPIAYPQSMAGSLRVQDDLTEFARAFDSRNAPREGRTAYMDNWMMDVLLKDSTISSRDFQSGENDLIRRRVTRFANFEIIEVPPLQFPHENDTSNTDINTPYRADFSKTAILCTAAPDAVGSRIVGNSDTVTPFGPDLDIRTRSHLLGAEIWKGTKWLRPEACGEIAIA